MARVPDPWYRTERDAWYVKLWGKQIPLHIGGSRTNPKL